MSPKRYLIAIPVAALDAAGTKLPSTLIDDWSNRVAKALTEWFGGATILAAPGASAAVQGETEREQRLVLAACDSRETFLAQRADVFALAAEVRRALSQETVLVLAFDSESFLVEDDAGPAGRA